MIKKINNDMRWTKLKRNVKENKWYSSIHSPLNTEG
jgi:hypothetical protein